MEQKATIFTTDAAAQEVTKQAIPNIRITKKEYLKNFRRDIIDTILFYGKLSSGEGISDLTVFTTISGENVDIIQLIKAHDSKRDKDPGTCTIQFIKHFKEKPELFSFSLGPSRSVGKLLVDIKKATGNHPLRNSSTYGLSPEQLALLEKNHLIDTSLWSIIKKVITIKEDRKNAIQLKKANGVNVDAQPEARGNGNSGQPPSQYRRQIDPA
jgi:hypothetical protein